MKDQDSFTMLVTRALIALFIMVGVVVVPHQAVSAKLLAAAASSNSVTLNWTAPGDDGTDGQASQYDIRYSTSTITEGNWNSATQVAGEPTPQPAGTPESFEVDGLAPATTYYFAIKAADEVPNWSGISNVVTKTTDQETTPPATITNVAPTDVTPQSVTITWTAPGDDGTSGTASEYDIRYSADSITLVNWDAASQVSDEPSPLPSGSLETLTITGLNTSTKYFFAIKTADEVPNWSMMSNIASATTSDEQTAPAGVANLATSSPTATSLTLTWTAPGDDGSSGTASEYDIRYSTSTITVANWNSATQVSGEPSPSGAGSAESFVVTGLNSSTTYYFALKTADEVPNWSALSNIASGTTGSETTPPANISSLAAVLPTQNSITLTWLAPGDDGTTGTASQYEVRYSTTSINASNWSSATLVSDVPAPKAANSPETLLVSGLNLSTRYYFAIKTADEIPNWSGLSNVVSLSTTADITPPATINDLQASAGEKNGEIDLSWTAPGGDGTEGRASLYEIRYSQQNITPATWFSATLLMAPPIPKPAGTSEAITVSGLSPGEIYYVAIKSYDQAANPSGLSNVDTAVAKLEIIADVDEDNDGLPDNYLLSQNYPNPFNPDTQIDFALPHAGRVDIAIYNIRGERVATLADRYFEAGEHTVRWNGTSTSGNAAATGVYMYRMVADNFTDTRKMVLLK